MGKRKAVWLHVEQVDYMADLSKADGLEKANPSFAMRKAIVLMRRAGIENLDQLKDRLEKVIATDSFLSQPMNIKPN